MHRKRGVFGLLRILVLAAGAPSGSAKYHSPPPPQPEGCDYIRAQPARYALSPFHIPGYRVFSDSRSDELKASGEL